MTVNISLCQEGCEFEKYNSETKKAKCNCPAQKDEINTNTSELKFDKNEMINEFSEILKDSNFKVLQCYKLPFNIKIFIKNIGSIIMTILLVIFLILIIVYVTKNSKDISLYIERILKLKELEKNIGQPEDFKDKKHKNQNPKNNLKIKTDYKDNPPKKKLIKKSLAKFLASDNKSIINRENSNNINNSYLSNSHASLNYKKNKIAKESSKNQIQIYKKNNNENKNKQSQNIINIKNDIKISVQYRSSDLIKPINKKLKKRKQKKQKKGKENNFAKNVRFISYKNNENYSKRKITIPNKNDINKAKNMELMTLNDQEMNTLEYEKAIEFDKRSYFQYYFSLLKKKQLVLFTFFPANDYNIVPLKISLFIVSFSLYFTINAFFFGDNAMHRIYKEYGAYNILYRIPQILYSSIIPTIINILLKTLSLTEKDILKIKQEKDYNIMIEQSKKVERCIFIKFIIFFIISLLFMLFFWYYISCFCAVYNNTQIIFIKDTLISFGISMLYPFGINLIPGIFRILALRAQKKDKECIYKLSTYIALI